MSDPRPNSPDERQAADSPFDDLIQGGAPGSGAVFTVGFRGYDKTEVDNALADLNGRLQRAQATLATVESSRRESIEELQAELGRLTAASKLAERLESDLATKNAQLADAEERIGALTAELVERPAEGDSEDSDDDQLSTRDQFEAVLRVAEEQANVLLQNASIQAERLLIAAREEVTGQRAEAQADIARITEQAQHDADQVRLKIDTEYTAHVATLEREAAHAAEKVSRAQREAEAVRTESEKGAAALRALVTRETTQLRSDTERDVREMNARVLEFEETLTRRQDDAQQEFLVLHNQAVAHAERITSDANEQVAASLEHSQLISSKADDYEKLMRAQAAQIDAEAHVRAQETLERARIKAKKIVDSVTEHTTVILRDAEDRTRQLRWQQQQLTSFMAEVRELVRPEGIFAPAPEDPTIAEAPADSGPTDADVETAAVEESEEN